ncbi:uncharacterized protein TNIN_33541 [Trichonephila inaurata madagascariensis]|uniref:Mutator-like transposase domain-containing protein n=1 Tax=Trichonephila inaurata madagascariensis TaxID=2747483 RepID=A0A8X6WQA6_9ARAC|nr:uncharacterized protein TNIN_33541 [Trichonephila inaurata madagascariensis]
MMLSTPRSFNYVQRFLSDTSQHQLKYLRNEEEFLIKEDAKINDGCVEGISTVPKNCAEEKNFADGAKPCTNETEPSATCVFFEAVKCLNCEKTGLRLHLNESNCGEAVKFHLKCPSCKYNYTFLNSKKCDSSENYELNTRLVYAMRCIGKGAESARMFCGIMDLPPPPTKFSKYNKILLQATKETCEDSMAEAVREAVDENDGKKDIAVAVDGVSIIAKSCSYLEYLSACWVFLIIYSFNVILLLKKKNAVIKCSGVSMEQFGSFLKV